MSENLELPLYQQRRSVSQLGSFTRCGEAYRLEKVAQVPRQPAAWFHQGTAFHNAIEEYEKSGRTLSAPALMSLYQDEYDRLVAESLNSEPNLSRWLTGGRKKAENDLRDRRLRGAEQVQGYIDFAEQTANEWRIAVFGDQPAVELKFDVSFGGVQVTGYIDQIRQYADGRLVPVDLKTGSRKQDSSFQLAVYAHAIHDNLGTLPQAGAFWEAKHQADDWWSLDNWNRQLLDTMFQDFDRAEKAMIYIPSPGDACRTCGVADYCRVKGSPELLSRVATITKRSTTEGSL